MKTTIIIQTIIIVNITIHQMSLKSELYMDFIGYEYKNKYRDQYNQYNQEQYYPNYPKMLKNNENDWDWGQFVDLDTGGNLNLGIFGLNSQYIKNKKIIIQQTKNNLLHITYYHCKLPAFIEEKIDDCKYDDCKDDDCKDDFNNTQIILFGLTIICVYSVYIWYSL